MTSMPGAMRDCGWVEGHGRSRCRDDIRTPADGHRKRLPIFPAPLPTAPRRSPQPARRLPRMSVRIGAAMGLLYIVWGSTYLAIRIGVETVPPLLAAGLRFGVAGLILLPLAVRARPTRRQLAGSAALGCWL